MRRRGGRRCVCVCVSGHCSWAPSGRAAALVQSLETAPATAERAGPPAATTPQPLLQSHCGESQAPSGDNARRSPFCSLWRLRRPLRREPGPQRRQRAPQPLLQSLETAPATAERAGPPAATTRAAAPSPVSQNCAGHCGDSRAPKRRQRAPQSLLQSLETTPVFCGESRVFSGDNARCSPFCSLTAERAGPPAATTRAAAPFAVSGDCAGHCGESRAPSGDNARRSPFCSLWRLRRPLRREPGRAPAATTRAAAPSAVSGDYAGHCGCEM